MHLISRVYNRYLQPAVWPLTKSDKDVRYSALSANRTENTEEVNNQSANEKVLSIVP